ncbi:hypothetical protein H2248_005636 [Termitomyces sp. 'cryptogamus']|nr:hypothetical protein H2248_005636 [Termitomyces sp. 'cryptogamus']
MEDNLGATVVDIPVVSQGANYYGFQMKLSNSMNIMARLARDDVNIPDFCGFLHKQVMEVKFEAAAYKLLSSEPHILASRLLYHRVSMQHADPRQKVPQDILDRRLFGYDLGQDDRKHLLVEAAHIRALLFEFNPPSDFAVERFLDRLFEHKPESLPAPVAPTRELWLAILISKIDAAIGNVDVIIEWEDDNATIGPIAAKAKESLLRLVHHILPADNEKSSFYRMVSDHGDFGIHMSIKLDNHLLHRFMTGKWDENAAPAMTRIDEDAKEYREECMSWSRQYFKALFHEAAGYEHAIKAGKDVRHFWFALRDW